MAKKLIYKLKFQAKCIIIDVSLTALFKRDSEQVQGSGEYMAIKNIIFDMGGVIIDFRPEYTLKKYFDNENDRQLILKEVFQAPIWRDMDRGTISVEQLQAYAAEKIPPHLRDKVCDIILNWFDEMPPKEDIYEVVKILKENGYKIYLLSNASRDFYKSKDNYPAFKLFDGFIISADYLLLKPERELYEILYKSFDIKPEESYFIDDMQINIDGAKEAGMDGYCFSDGDVEKLKSAMRLKGINI